MNEQEKEQFRKGEEIKRNAMSELNLRPSERALFESQKIRAIPQSQLNEMNWPGYSSPGLTRSGKNGIEMYVADKFPIVPNLTFGDLTNLQPYVTEKDVIPHEMGHALDRRTKGTSTERSAADFEKLVNQRGFEIGGIASPNAMSPSVIALGQEARDHIMFGGGPEFVQEWRKDPDTYDKKQRGYPNRGNGMY